MKQIGENWDDSTLSLEKVEANMLNKQVATMRREKALAYAYTHQVIKLVIYLLLACVFSTQEEL